MSPTPLDNTVLAISDGLAAFGQREIAFAVALRDGEDPARVRQLLEQLHAQILSFAERGMLVDDGGHTAFGENGFIEPHIAGVLYGDPVGSAPFPLPDGALVGVFVNHEELALAQATSAARVLSRLGAAARSYPFPAVSDRDRDTVARPNDNLSILSAIGRLHIPGVALIQVGDTLHMECRRGTGPLLQNVFSQLPPDAGFAFITPPSPKADARLVWEPGASDPFAITPPGSAGKAITGNALVVARTDDQTPAMRVLEDGFALVCTHAIWDTLQQHLTTERDLQLGPFAGMQLHVHFTQPTPPGTHAPIGGASRPEQLHLLTPEDQIARALPFPTLTAYMRELLAALAAATQAYALRVQLDPEAPAATLTCRPPLPEALSQQLAEITAPEVKETVAFLIERPPVH